MQPIATQSQEFLPEAEESNQAGIFITNEESFTDLNLPPKFPEHKQSTPLPELKKKAKGFYDDKRWQKKASVDYNTREIVIADDSEKLL